MADIDPIVETISAGLAEIEQSSASSQEHIQSALEQTETNAHQLDSAFDEIEESAGTLLNQIDEARQRQQGEAEQLQERIETLKAEIAKWQETLSDRSDELRDSLNQLDARVDNVETQIEAAADCCLRAGLKKRSLRSNELRWPLSHGAERSFTFGFSHLKPRRSASPPNKRSNRARKPWRTFAIAAPVLYDTLA